MWKAAAGMQVNLKEQKLEDDDWETDPDFINDVTEQEQRWGSATVEGSGRNAGAIDMRQLRKETEEADALQKKKLMLEGPNQAYGYGGNFGVQSDRMDQSAVGHDYVAKVEKHVSQKDYSTGFGGKFGVQTDRIDKSAVSWEYKERIEKHASQKDYSSGFGGKFGIQSDRQDKSAVGWDHVEKIDKHESQKDYSKGFGGKFGVQSDRQDKSAVGWDHHEVPQKHESQTDHKIGFGGKFGVQTDRMDKSAVAFGEEPTRVGTNYTRTKPDIGSAKPSDVRAKFENMNAPENEVSAVVSSPAPGKIIQSKAAMFDQKSEAPKQSAVERVPQQLDQSKTSFLTQTAQSQKDDRIEISPGQLDQAKLSQFTRSNEFVSNSSQIRQEFEQFKEQQKVPDVKKEELREKENCDNDSIEETLVKDLQNVGRDVHREETPEISQEEEIVDTGLTAVALYDYQAGAEDEISFDPEDVITHVEMIDEGWWRGMCKGQYGLFPANYVQLQE